MRKGDFFCLMPDCTVIAYDVVGKGTKVLIIHSSAFSEDEIIDAQNFISREFTVVCPSRRGWYGSGVKGKSYSMDVECADMIELMKQHEIENIYGIGYGAVIAMHIATKYPVKKMILDLPFIAPFRNYNWLNKMKKQLDAGNIWGAVTTYYRKTVILFKFFPDSLVKKFLEHYFSRPRTFEEAAREIVVDEYMPDEHNGEVWETQLMIHIKQYIYQIAYELAAACESEEELKKLKSVTTEIMILSNPSNDKIVRRSINKIIDMNKRFIKVETNPPGSKKVKKNEVELMTLIKNFFEKEEKI